MKKEIFLFLLSINSFFQMYLLHIDHRESLEVRESFISDSFITEAGLEVVLE